MNYCAYCGKTIGDSATRHVCVMPVNVQDNRLTITQKKYTAPRHELVGFYVLDSSVPTVRSLLSKYGVQFWETKTEKT